MPSYDQGPERKSRGMFSDAVKSYVQVEKIAQIGLILPCAVLIGWLGGAWLDAKLHQHWMTLTGFMVGCAAGMTTAIRMAMAMVNEPKRGAGNGPDKR